MMSKCCSLGPAGFPNHHRHVTVPAVSLYDESVPSPNTGLDYHLVHTLIPIMS